MADVGHPMPIGEQMMIAWPEPAACDDRDVWRVYRGELSGSMQRLYAAIVAAAGDGRTVALGSARASKLAGMCEETGRKCRQALIASGWLRIVEPERGRRPAVLMIVGRLDQTVPQVEEALRCAEAAKLELNFIGARAFHFITEASHA